MFGSEYSKHPEILMDSFGEMSHDYEKKTDKKSNNLILFFQKFYLKLFGIPEIGFQIRSLFFKNIILDKIKKSKIKKVFDAGSGIGTYSFWLARMFPGAKITAGEIDKNKLEFSEKFAKELKIKNVNFLYGDITKTPIANNKYDLIINIDVLEHIEDYKKVLNNLYKLLSQNGYLYIHTPQINQKRIFKSLESWHHEDHVREGFEPEALKNDLKKLGFKIIVARETFGFFGKLAWELNHLSFKKGFLTAGLTYPFLYLISRLDVLKGNKDGLGTAILAQKIN